MTKKNRHTYETVCKTVHQYNKQPIPTDDMQKLLEIAKDCCRVKRYVYQRYGGIRSLSKIYPGYTVQNEMIETGLREELGLPFVYFNLAVFDALADIKKQWTKTKSAVHRQINQHSEFSEEDKHYLRFLIKVGDAFEAVLNRKTLSLKADLQEKHTELKSCVDAEKLEKYLCRQVRRHHKAPQKSEANGFSLTERAYRYADHGIYITVKEKRKRIFVLLTDNNRYTRQIYIKLYPEQEKLEIKVPVDVEVKPHTDYAGQVGLAIGMRTMLVTDEGHVYGERYGEFQENLTDFLWEANRTYAVNKKDNPGRKKYTLKKRRMTEQLHSYINMELNRLIEEEQPKIIYIPKLPRPQKHTGNKRINYSVSMWQRGYIRGRLWRKCQEHSIEMVEVWGKDISNECSKCGVLGVKTNQIFRCPACGYEAEEKINAARNAKKRGQTANT